MSLCFIEAFKAVHAGRISDKEYIGHLTAHLGGVRHQDDRLDNQEAEKDLYGQNTFTTVFRVFALSNPTLAAEDISIYDRLLGSCSMGDFEATKLAFAELESNQSLPVPLQALAVLAAKKSYAKVLKFFLDKGATMDKDVDSALGQAHENAELMELLWDRNWRNIQHSEEQQKHLIKTSVLRPIGVLEFLLRQGIKFPDGLFDGYHMGRVPLPVMETIVSNRGIGPFIGTGTLTLAVLEGNKDVVEYLCKQGLPLDDVPPELDPREPCMCSPLWAAVRKHDIGVMEILLKHGANPNVVFLENCPKTVLQAAREMNDPELLSVIEQYASINRSSQRIQEPPKGTKPESDDMTEANGTQPKKQRICKCSPSASVPNRCYTPEEIGRIFADIDKLW